MIFRLKAYSILEVGQRKDHTGKPHQEDNIYPEYGRQSDWDRLFIVCDGMGGHDAGEVASSAVCDALSTNILQKGHEGFSVDDFYDAMDAAFKALDEKDNGNPRKMGTTMCLLRLHKGGAFMAHIGDSRIYHIRPGKNADDTCILYESLDHSLVNDLIRIGEMTREEALHSRQKNIITRAMQPNQNRKPKADIHETSDIRIGDYFFLCSDGMLEQPEMEDGTIIRKVFSRQGGDDEVKVRSLKELTAGNKDNHCAFIIHITDCE